MQRTHTAQQQQNKQPNLKMNKGLEQTVLQIYADGQKTAEKMLNITNH